MVTYVRRIFDGEGLPLGMICLNVPLDRIRENVVNMRITDSGYGLLMNERLDVIAYPNEELIGRNARLISQGFQLIADELEKGKDIFELELENYLGEWTVSFTRRLDNGWILTIATPKAEYYKPLQIMNLIISILGIFFAMILIIILVRIDIAKTKSDEQNRMKTLLLANIQKIREVDERVRIILNANPMGCWLLDKDYHVIECNQEMLHLLKIPSKKNYYDSFFEYSPEFQPSGKISRNQAMDNIEIALAEGYCRFEWVHQTVDKEPIPSEVTLVRVEYKGEHAVAGYIRDLREYNTMLEEIRKVQYDLRQAKDAAEESNRAKSKFLATMSHEIRTPMNVILGVTESQMMNESLPTKINEAFQEIFDSGHLLLHIINDILDFSKIESGKFVLDPVNYEILSLIYDVANMTVMQYEYKQLKFILKVDENIPLHLHGDELRVKQILNNLLSNAFKYTDNGEVELIFSAENNFEEKKTILIFSVRDTGQGMTKEQVKKIFEEYTRFNIETNRRIAGTGLGMAIVNNLVKIMEGKIEVNTSPNKGSLFTVRLPQGISKSGSIDKETIQNIQKMNFSNIRRERYSNFIRAEMPYGKVLVVDDMKSNLDVAKLLLTPYKLQIDTAESGIEAIQMINSGKSYDMIFMDHMMPKMDGIEAVKTIRSLGYKEPIVALTANAVVGEREMFLRNGFDGFISKPIDLRQLNDLLHKYVGIKKVEAGGDGENAGINISRVDTKTGLAIYGGDMDIYLTVLRSFLKDSLKVLKELPNVSEENLPKYAVNVHGLKGICSGIGAYKLRDAALELELMAKSKNLAGILSRNDALIRELENLTSGIQAWLKEYERQNPKPVLPQPDRALLEHLRKSCEDYDVHSADEAMEELEKSNYENDASIVVWLREKITESDFSSAAARISEYLASI